MLAVASMTAITPTASIIVLIRIPTLAMALFSTAEDVRPLRFVRRLPNEARHRTRKRGLRGSEPWRSSGLYVAPRSPPRAVSSRGSSTTQSPILTRHHRRAGVEVVAQVAVHTPASSSGDSPSSPFAMATHLRVWIDSSSPRCETGEVSRADYLSQAAMAVFRCRQAPSPA
jgi:hypothetical protein